MTSLLQGPAAPFGQPVERIKVKVRSHGMGSLQAVDRWLTHALAIEVGARQADCVIKSGEDLRRAAIELLVTRVLLLSRVLLQAAGVPFLTKDGSLTSNQSTTRRQPGGSRWAWRELTTCQQRPTR